MPLCLSFFSRGLDESVLRNHAYYSQLYGYHHTFVEADHVAHPALRDSYKYSQILSHLRGLEEGELLFFLDDNSVVFRPIALERLMDGRDLMVVDGPAADGFPAKLLMNMLLVRNTAANRELLHQLLVDSCTVITLQIERMDEASVLRPAGGVLECNSVVADTHVNVTYRTIGWYHSTVFVVALGPLPMARPDGRPMDYMLHDMNMQAFITRQVNGALMHGTPVLQPAAYPALAETPYTGINTGARIAVVSLYGNDIHSYARVSEHNVRRYCERHGYAYHVYRGIPKELDQAVNGTWIKPWVLQRHMADHDWIIWVDADTLFLNQAKKLEPLLEGRDLLLAKDIGGWSINAGVMGFRNTPRNVDILSRIWDQLTAVEDRSGVHVSRGDQYYINVLLTEDGLIGADNVLDNLAINTPPHLFRNDTLLVHFVNLGEPYRSAYMADVDAMSKRSN